MRAPIRRPAAGAVRGAVARGAVARGRRRPRSCRPRSRRTRSRRRQDRRRRRREHRFGGGGCTGGGWTGAGGSGGGCTGAGGSGGGFTGGGGGGGTGGGGGGFTGGGGGGTGGGGGGGGTGGGGGGGGFTGTVGTGTVGTGTVGTPTVGTGARQDVDRPSAEAKRAAATSPARPQSTRTLIQRRRRISVRCSARFLLAAMVQQPDHYAVLGVSPDASDRRDQAAFRRLALRLHPDVARGARKRGLPRDRRRVPGAVAPSPATDLTTGSATPADTDRPPGPFPASAPGSRLEWFEAERGASKPVEFEESVACDGCGGRGFEHGVLPGLCGACRGSGSLSEVTEPRLPLSQFHDVLRLRRSGPCSGSSVPEVQRHRRPHGATVDPYPHAARDA